MRTSRHCASLGALPVMADLIVFIALSCFVLKKRFQINLFVVFLLISGDLTHLISSRSEGYNLLGYLEMKIIVGWLRGFLY